MFKKKDIIPGRHFIKTKSGNYYFAMQGEDHTLYFISQTGYIYSNSYDENLQGVSGLPEMFFIREVWELHSVSGEGLANFFKEPISLQATKVWTPKEKKIIPIGDNNYYEEDVISLVSSRLKPVDMGDC